MSGVPLGVARDAIDRVTEILESKTDRMTGQPYREMEIKQQVIARAEGKLGAARAYVFDALTTEWEKLEADEPLTARERAAVMISRQQAFQMGREVAQMMFDLVGADAIYAQNRLERLLRDMNTACQHVVAQDKTLQNPGGLLLGSEKAAADFML